jgi:hypothetical protein
VRLVYILSTIPFASKLVENVSNNLHNYTALNSAKPIDNSLRNLICYISFCTINLPFFLLYSFLFLRVVDLVEADV